jgi:hypothetical protein
MTVIIVIKDDYTSKLIKALLARGDAEDKSLPALEQEISDKKRKR